MKYPRALLALWFLSAIAHADVYEGQIGKANIILNLEEPCEKNRSNSSDCEASYAYQKHLKDIPLSYEKHLPNALVLTASNLNEDITETISLKRTGTGWAGLWKNAKGKTAPVVLTKVNPKGIARNELSQLGIHLGANASNLDENELNTYDYLKATKLTFNAQKKQTINGEQVQWFVNPQSEIVYPRLTGTNDININRALQKTHVAQAIFGLSECTVGNDVKISYLSANILGLTVQEDYYCMGAAHPNAQTYGKVLNRTTGREYALDDILLFAPNPPKDVGHSEGDQAAAQARAHYMEEVVAPKLLSLIKARKFQIIDMAYADDVSPSEMREMMDECRYAHVGNWRSPTWALDKKGMVFYPYYPHVAAMCSVGFIVPWRDLKPYINPEFARTLNPEIESK